MCSPVCDPIPRHIGIQKEGCQESDRILGQDELLEILNTGRVEDLGEVF